LTGSGETSANEGRSIKVEFLFWGRSGANAMAREFIDLPEGTTVEGLLEHLGHTLGFDIRDEVIEGRSLFLTLNGAYFNVIKNRNRRLTNLDAVAVLPIVAGG
jgi:molybdopterin converting factor small subunit